MKRRHELVAGGRVVGSGTFKLDRRRAMEKMSAYQLETPHRYVVELVAAAVRAGATAIEVHNDADDLEISWDGLHPTGDDLDALFDHIFASGTTDHERMLHHLAVGVHGAFGLSPSWVRLVRPGLWLLLTSPLDARSAADPRMTGVSVHVRERFGWPVVLEAMPGQVPRETSMLIAEAWTCPVPLTVNGRAIAGTRRTRPTVPADRPLYDLYAVRLLTVSPDRWEGVLWLDDRGGISIVRDGVVVDTVNVGSGRPALRGAVRRDDLSLNASKSRLVEDERFAALQAALVAARVALLVAGGTFIDPETLRRARLTAIADHPAAAGPLAALPLFDDALGRRWTLDELRAMTGPGKGPAVAGEPAVLVASSEELLDPALATPQFRGTLPPGPDGAPQPEWAALVAACPDALRDGDPLLTDRREARVRRARLSSRAWPLDFGDSALRQRRFDAVLDGGEPVQGVVALGVVTAGPVEPGLHLELRVDGLPVETVHLAHPGTLRARVESPVLRADARFESIQRDRGYAAAVALARSEAALLLADAAAHLAALPGVQAALSQWLDELTRNPPAEGLPDALVDAPLLPVLGGGRVTVRSVQQRPEADRVGWVRRDAGLDLSPLRTLDAAAAAAWSHTLELDADQARSLRRLLGRRLVDHTEPLSTELAAAVRRTAPPEPPVVPGEVVARAPIALSGVRGEVALLAEPALPDMSVRVLRQGVPLGTVLVAAGRPGGAAAVEWDAASPTPDWSGLVDGGEAGARLRPTLVEALDALIEAQLPALTLGGRLPRWLVVLMSKGHDLPPSLCALSLFRSLDGSAHSLATLSEGDRRVQYLSEAPRRAVPGFDHCLLLDDDRIAVLRAGLGKDRLVDARGALAKAEQKWQAFWQRQVVPPALGPAHAGVVSLRGAALRGEVGIRIEPDAPRHLVVRLLHQGRLLTTERRPCPVPAAAVLDGDLIRPNARADGVAPDVDVAALFGQVDDALARALWKAVDGALDDDRSTEAAPPHVLRRVLRGLLVGESLPGDGRGHLEVLRGRPLLPLLGGGTISLRRAEAAAKEGTLRTVAPAAVQGPVGGGRTWVVREPEVAELLEVALGRPAPDGSREIAQLLRGQERRRALTHLPLAPPGEWAASMSEQADGAQAWIGLLSADAGSTVAWLVGGQQVAAEQVSHPVGTLVRVTHPDLRATDGFDGIQPGAAADACRALVEGLAGRFLLAVGGRLNGERTPATIGAPESCRAAVIRQAAFSSDPAWDGPSLVPTSDGRWLSRVDLRALATEGPLRLVRPGHVGPTLDGRPAIQAGVELREALRAFGPAVDYDARLDRDGEALKRRSARPVRPPPRPSSSIAVRLPCPRDGELVVPLDGVAGVEVHVGWRPVATLRPTGPVPLAGALDDPALQPNEAFDALIADDALAALVKELERSSRAALGTLVDGAGVPPDAPLWMAVLDRTFADARQVEKARGSEGRLADLPLFANGEGHPLTARQVAAFAQAKKALRWSPPGESWPSLQVDRPFVRLPATGQAQVRRLFGGRPVGPDDALEAARARLARAAPAELDLPAGRYLAEESDQVAGVRYRLALGAEPFEPARITWRVRSKRVSVREVRLDGLVGTVELPVEQLGAGGDTASLRRNQLKALAEVRSRLVAAAAPMVREQLLLRWRLADRLSNRARRDQAWWTAPIVTTPGKPVSLEALGDATVILMADGEPDWGDETERPPVVLDDRTNRSLLDAAAMADRLADAGDWLEQRRTRAAEKQAERQAIEQARTAAERRAARAAALRPTVEALLAGMSGRRDLVDQALDRLPTDGPLGALDPTGPSGLALAWWVVDAVLGEAGRVEDAAEVAARVGEHLVETR